MYEDLMEQAVSSAKVQRALQAVVRNGGAAGIDGMETSQLKTHLQGKGGVRLCGDRGCRPA